MWMINVERYNLDVHGELGHCEVFLKARFDEVDFEGNFRSILLDTFGTKIRVYPAPENVFIPVQMINGKWHDSRDEKPTHSRYVWLTVSDGKNRKVAFGRWLRGNWHSTSGTIINSKFVTGWAEISAPAPYKGRE